MRGVKGDTMQVGLGLSFNNPGGAEPEDAFWAAQVSLVDRAEALGFDAVWAGEHHFTDYCTMPDPLEFLSFVAGRTKRIALGTNVLVLPWHDPVRVTEQVALLDVLSGGRLRLGVGRGIAEVEFEGLGVSMSESRSRFGECAELMLGALASGRFEYEGELFRYPPRDLRPRPVAPFTDRVFMAAISPESLDVAARLGLRLLISAQKPWAVLASDLERYRTTFEEIHHRPAPSVSTHVFMFCDRDSDRAQELGKQYMSTLYDTTIKHYNLAGSQFAGLKGYEYYDKMSGTLNARMREAYDFFADVQVKGTPDECIEKIRFIQSVTESDEMVVLPYFGGMAVDEATRNLDCFAESVLPTLKGLSSVLAS
jgi:alkanesulfonate monooxygenase SsuD/methylene tetrahydromethanopterin reductase-like flavin-dependent oxidoreductase (luciferase family)